MEKAINKLMSYKTPGKSGLGMEIFKVLPEEIREICRKRVTPKI